MFGTRYYYVGLRGVGGKQLRAALTTAPPEMKWRNGFSASSTFGGEFSNVTSSCAGKGGVRHVW